MRDIDWATNTLGQSVVSFRVPDLYTDEMHTVWADAWDLQELVDWLTHNGVLGVRFDT